MGHVHAQLVLKNAGDVIQAKKRELPDSDVRQVTVTAMVDTGASSFVINKEIFEELGLETMGEREVSLANDAREVCILTEPLEIHWEDRSFVMSTLVVENAKDILMGVIPLEGMDLMVDTVNQRLVGAHGDRQKFFVVGVRG